MNKLLPLLLSLGALSVSAASLAFPFLESWHDPADGNGMGANGNGQRAGGGGIYGTGSRQDWGILCSDCRVREAADPPSAIDVQFYVTPPWDNVSGDDAHQPDTLYHIEVELIGEHLGLTAPKKGTTTAS
jgi:hypothetical protein